MSKHRYDIRISKSCVDPNPLMVERQDPDNSTRWQTRERCALEIAAYVFKEESKVGNRDWVDHQACSLLQYINAIANIFIKGNLPLLSRRHICDLDMLGRSFVVSEKKCVTLL